MKYKGAVIGCGFFATNHLHAWQEQDPVEIVALCDTNEEKAKKMATAFGIDRVYTDARQLFNQEPLDFVDIVTTVESHRDLVEAACLSSARLIVCQKPFASSLQDAEAMVACADQSGKMLAVHENFRYQRAFQEMHQRVAAGEIGKINFAQIRFRTHYDVYRNQPYLALEKRFLIMDIGLHLFDLVRHLVGDVAQLTCTTQRLNPDIQGEDAFTCLLHHKTGAVSMVDASYSSWYCPDPFPQTLATLEGTEGTMELVSGYRLKIHANGTSRELDLEPSVPRWGAKPWHAIQDSVLRFQAHIVSVLKGEGFPQPSGAHNTETLKLALNAYMSAEQDWP